MPTLDALFSEKRNLEVFSKEVAKEVMDLEQQRVAVNDGIKTPEELNDVIRQGAKVSFSYQQLIEESKAY